MKEMLILIELLCKDLLKNFKIHIENEEKARKKGDFWSLIYMNKNCSKVALKRKIIFLIQQLLNLERMLDDDSN